MSSPSILPPHPVFGAAQSNYPINRFPMMIMGGLTVALGGVIATWLFGALPYDWAPPAAMLFMGLVTGLTGWLALHRWNWEIILYDFGFTLREGSVYVSFLYQEIEALRLRAERVAYFGGRYKRVLTRITIITEGGEHVAIGSHYLGAAELAERLQERVYRHLRPIIVRKLASGDAIRFGETLRLSARGVHEGGRDLAWSDYGGYRIGDRQLALLKTGGEVWFSQPLWEYDNLPILIDILKTQRKDR